MKRRADLLLLAVLAVLAASGCVADDVAQTDQAVTIRTRDQVLYIGGNDGLATGTLEFMVEDAVGHTWISLEYDDAARLSIESERGSLDASTTDGRSMSFELFFDLYEQDLNRLVTLQRNLRAAPKTDILVFILGVAGTAETCLREAIAGNTVGTCAPRVAAY